MIHSIVQVMDARFLQSYFEDENLSYQKIIYRYLLVLHDFSSQWKRDFLLIKVLAFSTYHLTSLLIPFRQHYYQFLHHPFLKFKKALQTIPILTLQLYLKKVQVHLQLLTSLSIHSIDPQTLANQIMRSLLRHIEAFLLLTSSRKIIKFIPDFHQSRLLLLVYDQSLQLMLNLN